MSGFFIAVDSPNWPALHKGIGFWTERGASTLLRPLHFLGQEVFYTKKHFITTLDKDGLKIKDTDTIGIDSNNNPALFYGRSTFSLPNTRESGCIKGLQKVMAVFFWSILALLSTLPGIIVMGFAYLSQEVRLKHAAAAGLAHMDRLDPSRAQALLDHFIKMAPGQIAEPPAQSNLQLNTEDEKAVYRGMESATKLFDSIRYCLPVIPMTPLV
jgi:hypothetical protein